MAKSIEDFEDWSLSAALIECGGDPELLRSKFAGQQLYIPIVIKPSHPLAQLFGWKVAKDLSDAIGGCTFHVASPRPRNDLLTLFLSHAQFKPGQIAAICQVTQRHVFELRKQWREAGFLTSTKNRG